MTQNQIAQVEQVELTKGEQIELAITAFAKAKKIGRQSVVDFIEEINSIKKAGSRQGQGGGRKVTDEAQKLRDSLVDHIVKNGGDMVFTTAQVSEELEVSQVAVNNTIKYLTEQGVNFVRVGTAEREAGKPGKPATLWQLQVA
jgi:response regulator of citrate/malate metabolism